MTNSFHQAVPSQSLPPGAQAKLPTSPVGNASSPVSGAVPASGTTTAAPAAAPVPANKPIPPVQTSTPARPAGAPQQLQTKFKISIPPELVQKFTDAGKAVGSVGAAGYGAYQNFQNMGMLDKAKLYMSDPKNFAQMMGAFSPVAAPLLQTGGLPLLLGAYSFLKDPTYLQSLTNGKIPKLGAANPMLTSNNFKMEAPNVTGTMAPAGAKPLADAVIQPPSGSAAAAAASADARKPLMSAPAYDLASGAGAMTAGIAASKAKGLTGQVLGKTIAPAMTAMELGGVREKVTGTPERSWRDVAKSHQEALNPGAWLENYHRIATDPTADTGSKMVGYLGNSFSNPYVLSKIDPLGNALSTVKGVDDWTGVSNFAHLASGGRVGTSHMSGKDKSVPFSIATMLHLNEPAPQKRVAPWSQ